MADWGAGGTTNLTTRTAIRAEMPVSVKSPETPHSFVSGGEIRRERAKVRPIEAPTMAIALVRTCTRTLSAMNAVTAAEIAPAPCSMRPSITIQMLAPDAARKLPSAKMMSPK